jgi:hypothetical protein
MPFVIDFSFSAVTLRDCEFDPKEEATGLAAIHFHFPEAGKESLNCKSPFGHPNLH